MEELTLTAYNTPREYLDATETWLLERESDNNLILGLCYGFKDKTQNIPDTVFVNVFLNGKVEATAVKTWHKIIVTGYTENDAAQKRLADYFKTLPLEFIGVFGTAFHATSFAVHYGKPETKKTELLVHTLRTVNDIPLPFGHLEKATLADLELIARWTGNFENDVVLSPVKTHEELVEHVKPRIEQGLFFKWIYRNEPVSIAAIVRKTKNTAVIGVVYTPDAMRGKGFASGCVYRLSKNILESGIQACVLFTDADNPVSNSIYAKIGYVPGAVYNDITFG